MRTNIFILSGPSYLLQKVALALLICTALALAICGGSLGASTTSAVNSSGAMQVQMAAQSFVVSKKNQAA
jgi:hypothetical protein